MSNIIIIGAGRDTKAIVAAARLAGQRVCGIYDDDSSRWGELILGVPIVGCLALAPTTRLPAVLGYDDPRERKAVAERMEVRWTNVVHPRAFLDQSAKIGPGTIVLEGAVAQADVTLRRHVMVLANVTISHDSVVENYARLSTGVVLAGSVRVGEGANLEAGALVIPNLSVGAWALLGPRAVVLRDVPENAHMEGLPARPIAGVWPLADRDLAPSTR
jgi:sugar O-acyltransferase (sialic acid O-acetyltransferase NeuD family)